MKTVTGLDEVTIEVAGAALKPHDANCLAELRVRQVLSLSSQCELAFRGVEDEFAEEAALLPGLSLAVKYEETGVFAGEVTAIEHVCMPDGGREIRLRAYDSLHRLRRRQPVEFRNDVSAGELCRQFAGEIGLSADIADAGPRWPRLAQWHQTDLDLLAETSRRAGLYFGVWDGTLHLFTLQGSGDPSELRLGEDLFEAAFEFNTHRAWGEVTAIGWNPGTGDRFEASAGSARSGRETGASLTTSDAGGEGKRTLVNTAAPTAEHVDAAAQGALDCASANAITVRGVATGHPGLHPGSRVRLAGVHPTVAGTYVLAEVEHTLDPERGFLSEFSSEIPDRPRPSPWTVVATGVVERVDDPDNQGRVTVKLPGYAQIETGWMRVLLPGGGKSKGFVMLPDEGDEVLVLLPEGNPSAGIVLGGLFGTTGAPDTGIVERRVKRMAWRSPEGHYVEIDDERKRVTMKHANGSTICLGDDRMSIDSVTDFDIKASGRHITITAGAVDFRKG